MESIQEFASKPNLDNTSQENHNEASTEGTKWTKKRKIILGIIIGVVVLLITIGVVLAVVLNAKNDEDDPKV